ncbi:cornulin-like [Pseudonaja textilis]|uniref:cornulin-like n=1 Tax=Pseudonaja textilis TaxID=8673 RepID=UPI000EA91A73|nr:cornulin-like [Pseudonaja textilis]
MCEEMSHLLRNIRSIICIFEKYAKDDGDCGTLSKGELKQLIQTEFADVIVDPHDPKTIETVLHLLDTDCDGKVGFEEFTVLVFKVVKACYKKVQECQHTAGGPSKRDITNIQQRDIPPQQVSRDGPSQRDISRTQQRDIPPQQLFVTKNLVLSHSDSIRMTNRDVNLKDLSSVRLSKRTKKFKLQGRS